MSKKPGRIVTKHMQVSIVTITQANRYNCLMNLYELIKLQNYQNIKEWVIVEGSKNESDALINKNNIKNLIDISNSFNIEYIEYTGKKLGGLRNIGNNKCTGDIIVCMDDDDYYPPERISNAVDSLVKSSCLLAGCSDVYMYDYLIDKLYKFKGFHDKHSTNNCIAFKKEYLLTHKHDETLDMGEESSFTNNFTEPMVQLVASKCIIVSSHCYNTFNKRELCVGGSLGINPSLFEVTDHPITNYIPSNIYKNMKNLFYKEESSQYDIVYMTGGFYNKWDPKDKSLGGSEQAIVNLCENWVKYGKKVAVYGEILSNKKETITHNGVDYTNWKLFEFNQNYKTVIMWRGYGLSCCLPFNIKATHLYWDIHDNFSQDDPTKKIYLKYKNKINKILLKSNYHKDEFNKYFGLKLKEEQYAVISNGLKIKEFSNNWDNVIRNPYRFCYVSYYTRGLELILKNIWPLIKKLEPKAELHLYYGLDMFKDENLKGYYKFLIGSSPGVIDHGRQNTDFIVREKYLSNFQLYITNTPSEIDCISIRESLIAGCIPLISNFGVFKEREGVHFELDDDINNYKQISEQIIKLIKNKKETDILRDVLKKSSTIIGWDEIAKKILEL